MSMEAGRDDEAARLAEEAAEIMDLAISAPDNSRFSLNTANAISSTEARIVSITELLTGQAASEPVRFSLSDDDTGHTYIFTLLYPSVEHEPI